MNHPRRNPKDASAYTYADYKTWPEDERWELIDGEPFDMTPAPMTEHQTIAGSLHGILWAYFEGKPCRLFLAPCDLLLPKNSEDDDACRTVVQPDLFVVCDPEKISSRNVRGGPDLVIEVLSQGTASRDHVRKRALYEAHGVKEYWLVHPLDRLVTIYRRAGEKRFGAASIRAADGLKLTSPLFPGLEVDFARVFPPLPKKVVRQSPRRYQ